MDKKFKNLGNFLRQARMKKGFSQGQVAKKLGYTSPQFISNFERGIASPPCKNLKVLVDMYGISPNELIEIMYEEQQMQLKAEMVRMKKAFR